MYSVLNNAAGDTYMLTLISDAFLHLNNRDSAGWYAYAAVDSAKKHRLKKELADAYRVLYRYHYHFLVNINSLLTEILWIRSIIRRQILKPVKPLCGHR